MRFSDLTTHSFGGRWTQEKLEILRRYLDAYTTALKNQPFNLIYVDAFAGSGSWRPRTTYASDDYGEFNEMRQGSARIALDILDKTFDRVVFIEKDPDYVTSLNALKRENPHRNIDIRNADADYVIPKFCLDMADNERAVVFLDPYATDVAWATIEQIAETRKIDCWILFPLMAITRLMPVDREPDEALSARFDRIFGGREYWHDFYTRAPQQSFWGDGEVLERKHGSDQIADAFRERLISEFTKVAPTRRVLKNSVNSNLFDLFFAASNPKGASIAVKIADHILNHW